MAVEEDLAFARLLGILYTEVFTRKTTDPNKPINRSSHQFWDQPISDDLKSVLSTATNVYVWGPGGSSPEVDSSTLAAEWGPSLTVAVWS